MEAMIFQVHFTIAMELIALLAGTWLLVKSTELTAYKKFTKLVAYFTIGMAIILLVSTGYFMYLAPQPGQTSASQAKNKKPKKLHLSMPSGGKTKGGFLKEVSPDSPKSP